MTYLELCQALRRECSISGTGPSGVTNQTGELARVVQWVADAYKEIQNSKPHWRWMRSEFTLSTTASDDDYLFSDCTDAIAGGAVSRFRRWYPDYFKIYLTSAGVATEHWLPYVSWDVFRQTWKVGTQSSGYPAVITFDPRNHLRLGPAPDAIYTVSGDYQKSAQILAADADEPEMPEDFHMLIVYYAMQKYAGNTAAPEVWTHANNEAKRMLLELQQDQLPPSTFANPLA